MVRSLADLDRDDGRAQDVPGPLEPDSDPGPEIDRLPVAHPLDLLRGLESLLAGVERQGGGVFRGVTLVVVRGLLFLEVP